MKKIVLIVGSILVLLSGCTVWSFYPLYTKDTLVLNDEILGTWVTTSNSFNGDDVLIWTFSRKAEKWVKKKNNNIDRGTHQEKNKYTYKLDVMHEGDSNSMAEFKVHIVKIGDNYYLDFHTENYELNNSMLVLHLMPVHTFAKARFGEELTLEWFDFDWFEDLIKNNKIRIKHEENRDNIVLTARPEELQKFVLKYGNDTSAFEDGINYVLQKQIESETLTKHDQNN